MLLRQVNRILCKRSVIYPFLRYTHNEQKSWAKILYPLQSRKLLKISGKDASTFLQGLITNDMRHFEDGANSIYAMFLNNKGRVLYDTLIHRWEGDKSFLLECDKSIQISLRNHLKVYKLKRIIDVEDVNEYFKLWVLISPINIIPDFKIDLSRKMNFYKDPRLADLGVRIISSASLNEFQITEAIGKDISIEKDETGYKYLRYKLGVSEGAEDLPPGMSFPLEVNCDYLHGVSFHKGCYIGQELTARVHHTGVVRKRIMPLKFPNKIKDNLPKDTTISAVNNSKANLGKLRGFIFDYGLGLIRIKEALDAKVLAIGALTAEVVKPTWWPIEAPKEKVTLNK